MLRHAAAGALLRSRHARCPRGRTRQEDGGGVEVKSEYKQTEVGVIPEAWEVAQIEELKPFVTSGSRGWAPYYSDRGSLFVRITNLSRDTIYLDLKDSKFVNLPPDASEGIRTQLQEHDVLISITADIGIVGYVDSRVPTPAYINQHIALVRFDPTKTSGKFVSYYLASEKPQKLFRASTDVGAKAGMSLLKVQKLQLALPSHPEQRAIAGVLSDVDALIGALDFALVKKRDLKQAAMQQLLTGQKRLPGFRGEWDVKRLGELAEIISGSTPKTGEPSYWNGSIKWCTPTDITGCAAKYLVDTDRAISADGLSSCSAQLLPIGSLLLCSRATIGEVRIAGCEICTNQGFKSLVCKLGVSNEFLYYKLLTMKSQMIERAIGSTFLEISKKDTASLALSIPEHAEQTAIAEVLSDMDAELAALTQRRDKTRALKQGMMQELLTGRTRLV